jgi:hypothetical protein
MSVTGFQLNNQIGRVDVYQAGWQTGLINFQKDVNSRPNSIITILPGSGPSTKGAPIVFVPIMDKDKRIIILPESSVDDFTGTANARPRRSLNLQVDGSTCKMAITLWEMSNIELNEVLQGVPIVASQGEFVHHRVYWGFADNVFGTTAYPTNPNFFAPSDNVTKPPGFPTSDPININDAWFQDDVTILYKLGVSYQPGGKGPPPTFTVDPDTVDEGHQLYFNDTTGEWENRDPATQDCECATMTVTGKLSVGGIIDPPTGLEFAPQASNPTGSTVPANVLWMNSGDGNTLYRGAIPIEGTDQTTASNLGTGQGVYAQEVGHDLQFKSIKDGGSGNMTVTSTANEVNLTVNPANIQCDSSCQ